MLETPRESTASIGPMAEESPAPPEPLKPWIEVLGPPDNYDIPGAGEVGIVVGYVRVERAAPDIQLTYASTHVKVGNAPLAEADLTKLFYQPFGKLIDSRSALGSQPVNQLRAAIEVLRRYSAASSPRPVAHWRFDEGSGTTVANASGNGHTGALQGGAAWAAGRFGGGLSFDGVDDYVKVNNSPTLEVGKNGADFSVAFQLLLGQGATGQWRAILHKGAANDERTFAMWMWPSDNRLYYRISTIVSGNEGGSSAAPIALNTWTAIAYVKAGDHLQLYINGTLDSEVVLQGAPVSNAGPLYLGKDPWYPGINGCLDDLSIYNFALSAEQIQALAQAPPTLSEARYRLAAYQALLNRLGASDEEIRLARGARGSPRHHSRSRQRSTGAATPAGRPDHRGPA